MHQRPLRMLPAVLAISLVSAISACDQPNTAYVAPWPPAQYTNFCPSTGCPDGSVCEWTDRTADCVAAEDECSSSGSGGCSGGRVCSGGRCIAKASTGEGDKCSYNIDCEPGLICDWTYSPHRCAAPHDWGDSCGHDTDCQSWLKCEDQICRCDVCPNGTDCNVDGCHAAGTVKDGGLCAHNSNCSGELVCIWGQEPYVCGPPLEVNQRCGHPTDCHEDLHCSNLSDVCLPRCENRWDCEPGEFCFLGCEPRSDIGGPCFVALQCNDGLACLSSKCAEPLATGSPCHTTSDCSALDYCLRETDAEGECVPDVGSGEPCTRTDDTNSMCLPGLTCLAGCEADANLGWTGTCQIQLAKGEACHACPERFGDDPPSLGDAGPWTRECVEGLYCVPDGPGPGSIVGHCAEYSGDPGW